MHDRLARFEAHLRDYERLAPATVYAWTRGVRLLLEFVADPEAASAGEVSAAEFSAWLREAEEAGLASGTRQNRWYAVRA
ncbi:Phage integrase, N-terminal SAM-like domain [Quadrisphaera granulorum]|uniref:Phage integrase family protein with SAM-like domain n=1 Tax=Quadrisphaera granulorum TaxID=317664 RepID=A0A316A4E8_9ACTN|nr:site-specific integrase [Quadrisphaera granulorum]PWJ52846.1 phage integrase family protein with SAM-like domain [Quadrisphaera granulorum]SZE97451.1 Phage integrase, N-terminal SAM-like domain [Quadrisphaera granulorum]